jgi:3-hydroxymyristoyl/3-hydroxydecanoyl-(acyl carrier protein) dehydratase
MCDKLISLSYCALGTNTSRPIAIYGGQVIDTIRFHNDVRAQCGALSKLNAENVALFDEQAYPFCVSLFALLHLNKKAWIPGNNKAATAENLVKQGCILLGDWQGRQQNIIINDEPCLELQALDLNKSQLTIFTSGSNGEPKAINKSLQQLQNEIETLEQYWGEGLAQAQVLATVSHQHIYGLLFRVLWPLAAGRCFHSQMYLSPEPMLKAAGETLSYWVASPAQLKRLDELSPWDGFKHLRAIFSSGGNLPEQAASQIYSNCEHKVIEVYGSSETGGIAWRQQMDDPLWTSFNGVRITLDQQGRSHLTSPYLPANTTVILDDKLEHASDGQFALLGRVDRIVKVEEKRLSLDELEFSLNNSDWVQQSYCLLLSARRDKVGAALVLTEAGRKQLKQHGRAGLLTQLRRQLMNRFETVVLPRKWMVMNAIPLTVQSKIDSELLEHLLSLTLDRFPQIQGCDLSENSVELSLKVDESLIYFSGHFPDQPILPGVTQLAWVEKFGQLFFNSELPFLRMEAIKFKKIIRPGSVIQMKLNWKSESNKLYFELTSDEDSHSSGCMVYGYQP